MEPIITTAAGLASMIGVSPRSISDLAGRGIAVRGGRGFDLPRSVRNYCHHLREVAAGRGGDSPGLTAERVRLAKAQADIAELKAAETRGTMLDSGAVEDEWSGILRGVRAGMLAVPGRVSQRLPHLTPFDVSELDREVRAVLTELGNDNQSYTQKRA
jgi:phage terminase Nu1 subunit (DNA packaging protein)